MRAMLLATFCHIHIKNEQIIWQCFAFEQHVRCWYMRANHDARRKLIIATGEIIQFHLYIRYCVQGRLRIKQTN